MYNIKLGRSKKKYSDLIEELIEENFYKNVPSEKLNDVCKENHTLPCLCTHDGIKELNFVTKVDDKTAGLVLSYISTHMFYSLLMKR